MGIDTGFANLLARARSRGTDFSETITIGKQSIAVPEQELSRLASQFGPPNRAKAALDNRSLEESFFGSVLGVNTLRSMDYSDYQQADFIHDLNLPIPHALEGGFDTVIDGGSMEHIFDVKQVLANYMNLVKVGGSVFIQTTSNNLCGHGFYQFSPEFFYRIFTASNGFEIEEVVMIEHPLLSVEKSRRIRYFSVRDPAAVGKRIQVVNSRPLMIYVQGRRVAEGTPFSSPPLQSDYSEKKWLAQGASAAPQPQAEETGNPAFHYLSVPEEARRILRQRRKNSLHNKRFFAPIGL